MRHDVFALSVRLIDLVGGHQLRNFLSFSHKIFTILSHQQAQSPQDYHTGSGLSYQNNNRLEKHSACISPSFGSIFSLPSATVSDDLLIPWLTLLRLPTAIRNTPSISDGMLQNIRDCISSPSSPVFHRAPLQSNI